jgi:hypothetical protein
VSDLPIEQRGANGRWLPGNAGALKHGLRSARAPHALLPGQEELRAAIAERRMAITQQLGVDLSPIKADEVERYLRLWAVHESLWADIERHGILAKGKRRSALNALLMVSDRLERLAARLGLERRAKRVRTLADVLAEGDEQP